MKWLPVGVLTLGVAIAAYASDPLFENWSVGAGQDGITGGVELTIYLNWIMVLIYAPFLLAVAGGTVVAFRAMWVSTRRAELTSQLALGRSRGTLISRHVGEGAQHGLIAGLVGVFVGGSLRQIQTGFTGLEFVSNSLWNYIALVTLTVISFVLAYWIAATWVTRGSVRAIASGQTADAPVAPAAHGTRRMGRSVVLVATTTLAIASVALLVWSPSILAADDTDGAVQIIVALIVSVVITVGIAIALPGVLVYVSARTGVGVARALGKMAGRGAEPGSARSLAADGLARSMPMRTGAMAAVVAVMGTAVSAAALYFWVDETAAVADGLAPHAAVSTVNLDTWDAGPAVPSGWAEPLPARLLENLHNDPTLIVVEGAVLTSEPRAHEEWDEDGVPFMTESRDQFVAVDPAALDAVVPDAGRVLYLTDGTIWLNGALGSAPSYGPGGVDIEVNGVRTDTDEVSGPTPWTGISRPWAEGLWGPTSSSVVMLYPAGDTPVDEALAVHDVRGLSIMRNGTTSGWSTGASSGLVAAVTGPFLLIAVAIVIALAWSGQRLRARDQATLLALGATPAALRGAAALESFLVTAVAGVIGCLGGAVVGPILAAIGSSAPVGAAGPGLMLRNMGHTLTIMPWGGLIGLALGAAAVAAAGAALIRVRLDRLSPAQQLDQAQKVGAP